MSSDPKKTQKVISILLIALFFFMLLGLNDRLSEYFKLTRQRDEIATEVYALQSTEITLRTQIAYASGDNAVEDWARGEAHMALPGDIVIVPLTPSVPSSQSSTSTTPTPSLLENWQIWKNYLFGSD
jgi:cell division protein FtsB